MAPQIIYLALALVALMASSYTHGKPRTGKHNLWETVISIAIQLGLLYWGGFFNNL